MSLLTAAETAKIQKQISQVNTKAKFLIQSDSPSKKFKVRVVTMSGILVGYFKHFNDAVAYCDAN